MHSGHEPVGFVGRDQVGLSALRAIQFDTEYRARAAAGSLVPFPPVVVLNAGSSLIYADGITSRGFQLVSADGLAPNQVADVFIATLAGLPNEI